MNNKVDEEVDLRDYINLLRKRWPIVVSVAFIITIIAGIAIFSQAPVYESSALIKLGEIEDNPLESEETTISVIMSEPTFIKVGMELKKSAREIKGKIEVEKIEELLKVTTRGSSPEEAFELNQVVNKHILARHQGLLDRAKAIIEKNITDTEKLKKRIGGFIKELKNTRTETSISMLNVYIERDTQLHINLQQMQRNLSYLYRPAEEVSPAFLPEYPVPTQKKRNVTIAAVIGLIIGVLLAGLVEFLQKSE